MDTYFSIQNLEVAFNTLTGVKRVLSIDELNIAKGEIYGIVGESGAGKTVLAQTILRLLPTPPCIIGKDSKIIFDSIDLLKKSKDFMAKEIRGKRIAMIFQDPMSTLNPVFTVGEQISSVIKQNKKVDKKQIEIQAIEMLEKVKMPDAKRIMDKYPHQLSGGQRQRVIIATALSCGAEFLIADEPTRNLDVTIQAGILKIIDELRKDLGITVLSIANNMSLVSVMCNNVAVIKDGSIVEKALAKDIINSPKDPYTVKMLETIGEKSIDTSKINDKTENIMEIRKLKKYFPIKAGGFNSKEVTIKAVDGVDLDIKRGETLGIVGESGCGKTTFINVLLNLEKPTEGEVRFNDMELYSLSKKDMRSMRKNIQVVFQDPFWSLNPRMLIKDVIGEPIKVHQKLSKEEFDKKISELLELVGLPVDAGYRFPHEFSGGQRQRIAIARALALGAEFIVLDEPTSSIDVVSQVQILQLLNDLKEKYGLTYVLISHDLSVVNHMSTKIMVMYLGKVMEQGKSEELFKNPLHPYTKALMGAIPQLHMNSVDDLFIMEGNVPSAIDIPKGCRFHTRCTQCVDKCFNEEPKLKSLEDGRLVACHLL